MVVRSIDIGYGNVKFCHGEYGHLTCDLFPSIARPHTGVTRGAEILCKRDLIAVDSGESTFLVGKDSQDTLSARDDLGSHLLANYIDTPQYLALVRGALGYMKTAVIDLMVTGLPVDHYAKDKTRLYERLVGQHDFPDGNQVLIKDAWIIPQPAGGFIDYFIGSSQLNDISDIKSLTIDVGYFTLDWLTCRGLKMQEERCGSTAGGMSMILERLAELIAHDRGKEFTNLNIVDEGIRNGFIARIQGKDYPFAHLMSKLDDHIVTAVQSVVRSVGSLDDIDLIILVGGGANCYKKIIEHLLNREVIVPESSIFSNVKGFYLAGYQRLNRG